jgi:hypothetical protein
MLTHSRTHAGSHSRSSRASCRHARLTQAADARVRASARISTSNTRSSPRSGTLACSSSPDGGACSGGARGNEDCLRSSSQTTPPFSASYSARWTPRRCICAREPGSGGHPRCPRITGHIEVPVLNHIEVPVVRKVISPSDLRISFSIRDAA